MRDKIIRNIFRSLKLYKELLEDLPEECLGNKLPGIASNTVGEQFWCLIGARESYIRALQSGAWIGFSCSLSHEYVHFKDHVTDALNGSFTQVVDYLGNNHIEWSNTRDDLLLDFLEHEILHHGQLIRYLYGLRLPIPDGWKRRYELV